MDDSAKHRPRARGSRPAEARSEVKTINLALQGGGAHGAFAWGVLDALLEDERLAIEGISATSAGAMNAVVLAHGLAVGGREGGRAALADFWRGVNQSAAYSPLQPSVFDRMAGNHSMQNSPAFFAFEMLTRLLSPYQLNPFNHNPLRGVLEQVVDFERLRQACPVKLYLCATNVRTGKVKVFGNDEMSVDSVLASACLPFMFQAVEVEGEHYWDGGYMGNPAIFPLIYGCACRDVVVVHTNPITRQEVPRSATEIMNRLNEISFNSSLMREMRAIAFVTRLIDEDVVKRDRLRRILIHAIEAEEFMRELSVASKLNPDWEFLTSLHDIGREKGAAWIEANFARLDVESTVDIRDKYL